MIFFSLLKKQISDIEKRVPFIPDFSDLNNIGKIALVSFWMTVIYSFTQIEFYNQFYDKLWYNVKNFIPISLAHEHTSLILVAPALCPAILGMPFFLAYLLFPSIIIAI